MPLRNCIRSSVYLLYSGLCFAIFPPACQYQVHQLTHHTELGRFERAKSRQGSRPGPLQRIQCIWKRGHKQRRPDGNWILQESIHWRFSTRAAYDDQDVACRCRDVFGIKGHADIVRSLSPHSHLTSYYRYGYISNIFFCSTSADTFQGGQARGALSWAFIEALRQYPKQSYLQLLNTIRSKLERNYSQKPQLSCSHPLGM